MNEFELTITVDRPVEDVWAFFQDYPRYSDWNPGVAEVRQTGPGPMAERGRFVFVGRVLGRNFESNAECTAYVPNRRFAVRTTSGPFLLEIDTAFEPAGSGTRLTTVYRGENHGFVKLTEPVAVRVARKLFEAANENLKALLEAERVPA